MDIIRAIYRANCCSRSQILRILPIANNHTTPQHGCLNSWIDGSTEHRASGEIKQ
jgi:hypothetical protein